MREKEVELLQKQITTARNEIHNLRQQVCSLQHLHRKDIEGILDVLKNFRCKNCQHTEDNIRNSNERQSIAIQKSNVDPGLVKLRTIGVIRTAFPEKRAVPRQSSIGNRLRSLVELNAGVFTNPEHSLDGLEEYSHMWLIYHFHKNNTHPKAKVAPPRLSGGRVGVFSTRSPHRPSPIGLSLVEIDKIKNAQITFFGTDMIDGTPVLDIKPYIPFYDTPMDVDTGRNSVGASDTFDFYNSRQEPDGEEDEPEMLGAGAIGRNAGYLPSTTNFLNHMPRLPKEVKVPSWVMAGHRLTVCFNEHAESQLHELQVHKQCIVDILEGDPRSVYLRTKYGSQIFTFQLSEVTVTCKFNDHASTVTVVQIRRTDNLQSEDISAKSDH